MADIQVLDTGILYRNPKPYLRSVHAFFPTVAHLGGEEMLAAFALGSAFEAVDLHTETARSTDGGRTWTLEGPLAPGAPHAGISDTYRIACMDDGEIVAFGARYRRDDLEMGFVDARTMGFVPCELALYRSGDKGRSWEGPEIIEPSLKGQPFEICSPIVPLDDGRWLAPTSLWPALDGACPHGIKAIALVSHDGGKSWPAHVDIMDRWEEGLVLWEQCVAPIAGNRVVSLAWCRHRESDEDRKLHYAVSADGGRSFGPPLETDLEGQTVRIVPAGGSRLLVIYRRTDETGLWATMASVEGDGWSSEPGVPLWQGARVMRRDERESMVEEFQKLKFGAPSVIRLPDGDIYIAFWCVEDCASNIRWIRIRADGE